MIPRTYRISVVADETIIYAPGGNVLGKIGHALGADDLMALLEPPMVIPIVDDKEPAALRWLERLLIVFITSILVYNCGPTIMWLLFDTTDYVSFHYGSPP